MANDFRARLLAGELLVGVTTNMDSIDLVEVLGQCGFDWVMIDLEHGSIGDHQLALMVRACELTGVAAAVRVQDTRPATILRACDLGAAAIVAPLIDDADQAREFVSATRYPPEGTRGLHPVTRASSWGAVDPQTHMERSNASICTIAQIESVDAAEGVEEIVGTPGLDAVLVGPRDLANSLVSTHGGTLDAQRERVKNATAKVFAAAQDAGVRCGAALYDLGSVEEVTAGGGTLLLTGFVDILRRGARERAELIRGRSITSIGTDPSAT